MKAKVKYLSVILSLMLSHNLCWANDDNRTFFDTVKSTNNLPITLGEFVEHYNTVLKEEGGEYIIKQQVDRIEGKKLDYALFCPNEITLCFNVGWGKYRENLKYIKLTGAGDGSDTFEDEINKTLYSFISAINPQIKTKQIEEIIKAMPLDNKYGGVYVLEGTNEIIYRFEGLRSDKGIEIIAYAIDHRTANYIASNSKNLANKIIPMI